MISPISPITTGGMFGGMAIIGILTGLWTHIKLYGNKILSLLVINVRVHGDAAFAITTLLNMEFKSSPLGHKVYQSRTTYVRPTERNQIVAYEIVPREPTIWWRGKRPVLISMDGDYCVNISFIRGVYNKDKFIVEAIDKFNTQRNTKSNNGDRFKITRLYGSIGESGFHTGKFSAGKSSEGLELATVESPTDNKYTMRPIGWTRDEIGQPISVDAIDNLSLNDQALVAIEEAHRWRECEKWFKKRSIPWKRGWLLEGPPGTGKTAFTRALGQDLNMPIFSFDLATMTNKDFSEKWSDAMSWSPCIALFEDFDAIFNGRKNIAVSGMDNGLTFDGFLNGIDGATNTDGVFVIITTNNIDTIDPAIGNAVNGDGMSTRPGRIDRMITFTNLDESGRIKMATRILGDIPKDKWEYLINDYVDDSGAQFQERCCRLALELFWKQKK